MTRTQHQTDGSMMERIGARLLPRVAARLIDGLLLAGLGLVMGRVVGFGPGWLVGQAAVVFTYFVVLDVVAGRTLGKRVLGLQVTGADGRTPTVRDAAIREAFTLLGAVPFVGPLLAAVAWVAIIVTVNASPTRQGVHDRLAAGTLVARA